jgi:hypothetical protein
LSQLSENSENKRLNFERNRPMNIIQNRTLKIEKNVKKPLYWRFGSVVDHQNHHQK